MARGRPIRLATTAMTLSLAIVLPGCQSDPADPVPRPRPTAGSPDAGASATSTTSFTADLPEAPAGEELDRMMTELAARELAAIREIQDRAQADDPMSNDELEVLLSTVYTGSVLASSLQRFEAGSLDPGRFFLPEQLPSIELTELDRAPGCVAVRLRVDGAEDFPTDNVLGWVPASQQFLLWEIYGPMDERDGLDCRSYEPFE